MFDTRVVVGAPYHRTPVFSADMTYVEINPYWNVPSSIARNELLPKIKEDPGYLGANDFELLSDWGDGATALDPWSVDWSRITPDTFTYRLRQRPGDGNALGRIKFMFPNQFNVYLHDTPARHLFEKTERSFSHGCIRVDQPESFGAVVLADQDGWSLDRIYAAIKSDERHDRDPRAAAAGAHRLPDRVGEQGRLGAFQERRLRPRRDPRRRPARPPAGPTLGPIDIQDSQRRGNVRRKKSSNPSAGRPSRPSMSGDTCP